MGQQSKAICPTCGQPFVPSRERPGFSNLIRTTRAVARMAGLSHTSVLKDIMDGILVPNGMVPSRLNRCPTYAFTREEVAKYIQFRGAMLPRRVHDPRAGVARPKRKLVLEAALNRAALDKAWKQGYQAALAQVRRRGLESVQERGQ